MLGDHAPMEIYEDLGLRAHKFVLALKREELIAIGASL